MATIHQQDLSIWEMVQNRLPFLDGTSTNNETLVSDYTLEMMHEIEPCLKIEEGGGTIGVEADYSISQRGLIADLVTCYILLAYSLAQTGGTSSTSSLGTGTAVDGDSAFLKKAKAGSVEVEFAQFDLTKNAGLQTNTDSLLTMYKKSAVRRAGQLGCTLDLCDDCSISWKDDYNAHPFSIFEFGC